MYIAKVKDTDELVDAMEVLIEGMKHLEFVCPHCNSPLQLKNGSCNAPHFAHVSGTACDDYDYNNDMSEWHRYCQTLFPKQYREVKITGIRKCGSTNSNDWFEQTHIADVCIGNYVLEFQHSPISVETFNDRSGFYTELGYKLIWIFDFREKQVSPYSYSYHNNLYGGLTKWEFKHAPKFAQCWNPKNYQKDNMLLCFEDYDNCIHHICWAKPNKYDSEQFDWSRICTKFVMNPNINTLEKLAKHIIAKCNKKTI